MYETLSYEELLKKKDRVLYVDVRSPGEFEQCTIPGAINIPILDNEERKVVGTIYKSGDYDKAKLKGVEFVAKKLLGMVETYLNLNREYKYVAIFCARGGYRSSTIAAFLFTLGLRVYKINGGYKAYRNFISKKLDEELDKINFVTIYGNTGTGKTKILDCIKQLGHSTLDLEGHANHRGSLLGSTGMGAPRSQKMFESLVFDELMSRNSDTVFIEGESKRIGNIILPEKLFNKLEGGRKVKIEAPMNFRVKNIMDDYVVSDKKELIANIEKLRRYLSNKKVDEYIGCVNDENYEPVVEDLCINYYDPMYEKPGRLFEKTYFNEDNLETAKKLVEDFEGKSIE